MKLELETFPALVFRAAERAGRGRAVPQGITSTVLNSHGKSVSHSDAGESPLYRGTDKAIAI
jgi:hypothetical protein